VTIVAERAERPTDFAPRCAEVEFEPGRPCPFCPGNEEASAPALERLDEGGSWKMRVLPNRYPAFSGDEPFAVHHLGPVHVEAEASGIHEVFVYSRDHDGGLHALSDHDAADMMRVLQRRFSEHAAAPHLRFTQAIINHGREAGASLSHPHGQLLGLPFVPGEVLEEQRGFNRFEGGCILCTTVEAELVDGKRVVFATDDVLCICPFWSGSPFEMMIIPRRHDLHLNDADDTTLAAVGVAIRDAIAHLREVVGDVSFNLVFSTAPHHYTGAFHWHVNIWPKLNTTAGFERGTGVLINIVPPETAAEYLRSATVRA
jgi:UDPglucose--hexose-1-phosphate uridylyltransferase